MFKNFKNIGIAALFVLSAITRNSAQDYAVALKTPAVYNHYHLNPFLVNPAATGADGVSTILLNYRDQWAGFPNSPKGFSLGINGASVNNMGIGGLIYSENYGVANRFIGQGNYAYHFKAGSNVFSLGLAGSYIQYSLDNDVITDPQHQGTDPTINEALNGEKYFAADLGFNVDIAQKYFLGVSIPHIVETALDNKSSSTSNTGNADRPVNFFALLGARFKLPDYRMVLEPSVGLKKISDVPFGTDVNIIAKMLDEKLFGGFTYSFGPSSHRLVFLGGVRLDKFKFFYSYDQSYADFQGYNNGSHELTLSVDLYKLKPKMMKQEPMPETAPPSMENK